MFDFKKLSILFSDLWSEKNEYKNVIISKFLHSKMTNQIVS